MSEIQEMTTAGTEATTGTELQQVYTLWGSHAEYVVAQYGNEALHVLASFDQQEVRGLSAQQVIVAYTEYRTVFLAKAPEASLELLVRSFRMDYIDLRIINGVTNLIRAGEREVQEKGIQNTVLDALKDVSSETIIGAINGDESSRELVQTKLQNEGYIDSYKALVTYSDNFDRDFSSTIAEYATTPGITITEALKVELSDAIRRMIEELERLLKSMRLPNFGVNYLRSLLAQLNSGMRNLSPMQLAPVRAAARATNIPVRI